MRVSFRPRDTGDALAGGGQVEDDGVVISGVLRGFYEVLEREGGGEGWERHTRGPLHVD